MLNKKSKKAKQEKNVLRYNEVDSVKASCLAEGLHF